MNDEELKLVFKKAAELSKAVPENLQEAAFNRAVDVLLGGEHANERGAKVGPRERSKKLDRSQPGDGGDINSLFNELDRTQFPQMNHASRVVDNAMILIRIAREKFQINGLSASQIATVLTDKFRFRTTRQAVNQALDKAGDKVDRFTDNSRTLYRVMAAGEEYLDAGDFRTLSKTSTTKQKIRKKPKGATKSSKPAKKKSKRTSKRKSGSNRSLGPMGLLRELLEEGFFDKERKIGDIQKHLRSKKGRTVAITTLSPTLLRLIRETKLDRNESEDGQYEYKKQ
ncbi:MAG: hypothetical protein IH914_02540 [candidate division Zixibacteria bacterium]|nr:hypothetical protein [candidate division Zixibacteria bacterium]